MREWKRRRERKRAFRRRFVKYCSAAPRRRQENEEGIWKKFWGGVCVRDVASRNLSEKDDGKRRRKAEKEAGKRRENGERRRVESES